MSRQLASITDGVSLLFMQKHGGKLTLGAHIQAEKKATGWEITDLIDSTLAVTYNKAFSQIIDSETPTLAEFTAQSRSLIQGGLY